MDRMSVRSSLQRSRIKSFPICSILVVLAMLLSICSPSSATETNSSIQEGLRRSIPGEADQYKSRQETLDVARRSLAIGSTPPACTGKCGRCTPCKAVSVPPGAHHVTKEYYPSVWRCQCGGKLYMLGRPPPPPTTHSSPGRVVNLPID